MKEAYVTLVATDSYAAGALVLCHKLRELGSKKDIVCLVTPNISSHVQEILSNNCIIKSVDILKSTNIDNLQLLGRPELDITFTKIQLWTLTNYDKLVFLDADTFPTRNIDDLFKWSSFSAAPDAGWPDCFNSGVFVTEPSEKTYTELLDLASKKGSFDGGDQGLLNSYFSSWSMSPSNRLPFTFNTTPTAQYGYAPAHNEYGQHVSVIHFIGQNKPWRYQRFSDGKILPMGDNWEGTNQMIQSWWDTWDTYYGRTSPYHLLSGEFNNFDDGFQTRPIVQFDEAVDNAWKDQQIDWENERRRIEPMPPMPTISIGQPDWLKQEIERQKQEQIKRDQERRDQEERERIERERQEHERQEQERRRQQEEQASHQEYHHEEPHHEEHHYEEQHHHEEPQHHHEEYHHHHEEQQQHNEPKYTFIEWDPAWQEPPNTGMGANIPDLASYSSNAWDQPYHQQTHTWVPPVHQPEPEIMKKPEYSHYNTEDYAPDAYYAPIHHEFNPPPVEEHHHHEEPQHHYEEPQHHHEEHHHEEHHHEEHHHEYYPPAFPWEEKQDHFPPPSRIWLDEHPQDYHEQSEPQQYHHHQEEHHHQEDHHHHEEPQYHHHEEHHEPQHHDHHNEHESHHQEYHEPQHHHEHHHEQHHEEPHYEHYHEPHHESHYEPHHETHHEENHHEPHYEVHHEEPHHEEHHTEHTENTEHHETTEKTPIENHPEPETPVWEEPESITFAIDEAISPSAQSKLDEFIASLASDDEDISDRDLIPINFKPKSRLSGMYTPSPGNSRSGSRVNSRSGSRRPSVSSSRRNSFIINNKKSSPPPAISPVAKPEVITVDQKVPFQVPEGVTQPHKLFAGISSTAFTHKTPYTSAAVTPALGPSDDYEDYFDDYAHDDDSNSLKSDFLYDHGYSLNESLSEPNEWDPLKALNKLKEHSESMVLRQSLHEALVKTAAQQQQQQQQEQEQGEVQDNDDVESVSSPLPPPVVLAHKKKQKFHFKSSWDDEEYDVPSALISGESSPRTPMARSMSSSDLSKEIELEKERYRQQRASLMLSQPQTAIASVLEAELDLSRGTLFKRRYYDQEQHDLVKAVDDITEEDTVETVPVTKDAINSPDKEKQELQEAQELVAQDQFMAFYDPAVIEESRKRLQALVDGNQDNVPVTDIFSANERVKEETEPVKKVETVKEVVKENVVSAKPVKEEAEHDKVETKAVKPVKEEAKPVKKETKLAKEDSKPVKMKAEPVKEEVDPVEVEPKHVKKEAEPVKKEPVKKEPEPVKKVIDVVKKAVDPIKRAAEAVKDAVEPAKKVQEPEEDRLVKDEAKQETKPTKEDIEPVKQVVEPVTENTAKTEEATEPVLKTERAISKEELEDPMPLPIDHFTTTVSKDDEEHLYEYGTTKEPQPFSLMYNFRAYQSNFGFNEHHKLKIYNPALMESSDQNEDMKSFNPEITVLQEDPIRKRQRIERERIEAEQRRIREEKEAEERRIREEKEAEERRIQEEKEAEKKKLRAQKRAEKRKLKKAKKATATKDDEAKDSKDLEEDSSEDSLEESETEEAKGEEDLDDRSTEAAKTDLEGDLEKTIDVSDTKATNIPEDTKSTL